MFPDYPKMGVWPDGYYDTFNMFTGNTFSGAKLCAFNRSAMLTGAAATQQCFQLSTQLRRRAAVGSGRLDRTAGRLTELHAQLRHELAEPVEVPRRLDHPGEHDAERGRRTLRSRHSRRPAAAAPAFRSPGCASKLDSLADRLMFRLAYRNFGDHESLLVNHSVQVSSSGKGKPTSSSGVRWYELRSSERHDARLFSSSRHSRRTRATAGWARSRMDKQGNMALGYSVSSSSLFPSIRYTGRLATDAANTMQAEATIIAGTGSQTGQNLAAGATTAR